jgi:hypothetical protein
MAHTKEAPMKSYLITGAAVLGLTMSSAVALAQNTSTTPQPKPSATTSAPATTGQPSAQMNKAQANPNQYQMDSQMNNAAANPGQENAAAKPGNGMNKGMQSASGQKMRRIALSRNGVKQEQRKLQQAGLYKGKIDGKSGRETRQALMQYQQQNNLQQTGRMDQQTAQAMGIRSGEQSASLPGAKHKSSTRKY